MRVVPNYIYKVINITKTVTTRNIYVNLNIFLQLFLKHSCSAEKYDLTSNLIFFRPVKLKLSIYKKLKVTHFIILDIYGIVSYLSRKVEVSGGGRLAR